MENHQSCYRRDSDVIRGVERHRVLDAEQIQVLYFGNLKSGKRIAQRRLGALATKQWLNRDRRSLSQPYHYYLGKAPGQVEHRLGLNWAFIWLQRGLKSWERVHSLEYEVDYKALRLDALVAVKNKVTGRLKIIFIEMDRSDNTFNKVSQITHYYQSEKYLSAWWVHLTDRFPVVLVATETERRYQHIREAIDEQNTCGLEFRLHLLSELREECLNGTNAV